MTGRGTGTWPAAWIRGHRPGRPDPDPPIQVHHWDERTVVIGSMLRQVGRGLAARIRWRLRRS